MNQVKVLWNLHKRWWQKRKKLRVCLHFIAIWPGFKIQFWLQGLFWTDAYKSSPLFLPLTFAMLTLTTVFHRNYVIIFCLHLSILRHVLIYTSSIDRSAIRDLRTLERWKKLQKVSFLMFWGKEHTKHSREVDKNYFLVK